MGTVLEKARRLPGEVKVFASFVKGISKEDWKKGATNALYKSGLIGGTSTGLGSMAYLGLSADASISAAFGGILGIVFTITKFVGIFLVVYGVFTAVMGYRGSNSDKTTTGITETIVGVVLIFLKSLVSAIPGVTIPG